MKLFLSFVISLLFNFYVFSQKKNCIVTKKDGTQLNIKNYRNKKQFLKLIFDDGTSQNLLYKDLDRIDFEIKSKKNKLVKIVKQFVRISERNGILMELILDGKCKVFSCKKATRFGNYIRTFYYVQRDKENIATELGSDGLATENYKKRALEYFQECPKIINRIKSKFRKKEIKELVIYYNNNCS
jgi:hypothetical protein